MAQDTATAAASAKKSIVVLGGSYAGMSIAHHLLKHTIPVLPEKESYEVVMASTASTALCRPATPRAMISDHFFDQDKLFVNIPKQFEQYPPGSFRFIQGTATALDHTDRFVTIILPGGTTEKLNFYALVIATGSSTTSPLLSLNGDDENVLRENWKTIRAALPEAKSIVIAGGGPSGVETAGELGEYLNGRSGGLFGFGSSNSTPKVKITLVTSAKQILPILRPSIAKQAEAHLAKVGVTLLKEVRVTSVSPSDAGSTGGDKLTTKANVTLDNDSTLEADIYIPAVGTTPNTKFITDTTLLASDNRIDTNGTTLRVDKAGPRIYAIGDVASTARPAVHLTMEAIPVLGANIRRDLLIAAGKEDPASKDREYKEDKRETHLVPIGTSKGVGSAAGWALPGFMVWLIKGRDYWLWTTGPLWSGKQWAKAG